MDKELTKIIEKREQYLDSKRVFDSPSEEQWIIYKALSSYVKDTKTESKLGEEIKYWSGFLAVLMLITGGLISIVSIPSSLPFQGIAVISLSIYISYKVELKGIIPTIKHTLGYKRKFPINLTPEERGSYRKIHKLVYVKGEFYRVWYIKYVLKLDPSTFVMTDPLYKHLYVPKDRITHKGKSTFNGDNQTRHLYTPDQITELLNSVDEDGKVTGYTNEENLDIEEIDRVNTLLREAREERDHWINSLTTARFLDYKEFVKIQEMDEAIDKAKELDIKVQQFEEYMKNKSKKREGK